jgi:hypothetical protein
MRREVTRTVWIVRMSPSVGGLAANRRRGPGESLYDSAELIRGVNPLKEMHLQAATGNVSLPALRSGDP